MKLINKQVITYTKRDGSLGAATVAQIEKSHVFMYAVAIDGKLELFYSLSGVRSALMQ